MKCKICGTVNEDYLEFCENCAAPLTAEPEAPSPATQPADAGEQQASWGFVRPPQWIQPEFDANTVSEEDIPANYQSQKDAQAQAAAQAYAMPDANPYAPNANPYTPNAEEYAPAQGAQGAPAYAGPRNRVSTPAYSAPTANAAYGAQQPYAGPQQAYAAPQQTYENTQQPYAGQSAYAAGAQPQQGYSAQSAGYGAPAAGYGGYGNAGYDAAQGAQPAYAAQKGRPGVKFAEPVEDDYYGYDASAPKARSARGARGARDDGRLKTILFWAAAGLLVVLIAVFSIIFFTRRAKNNEEPQNAPAATQTDTVGSSGDAAAEDTSAKKPFLGGLFSKSPVTQPPTVEEGVTNNGEPAYIITVYAKNNCTVRFTAGTLTKENPISKGSLKLRIPKSIWIPDEPVDAATVEVYPDITVINKKGEETPVAFESPIVVTLPTIDLTLNEPTTTTVTSADGSLAVSGVVGDTTAEVFVNETQLYLDESGNFTGAYTLPGYGSQEVNVEARKNGYQIARKTITVDYPDPSAGTATDPGAAGLTPSAATTAPAASGAIPSNATAVAYANTNDLNVRAEASPSGSVLGQIKLCTKVYVVMEDAGNGWAKIIYNNAEAYASAQYLSTVAQAAEYTTTTATVNTDNLKMRSTSSTSGEILTQLPTNTSVNLIKDAGSDWSMIEYNGMIGFVASQYITK